MRCEMEVTLIERKDELLNVETTITKPLSIIMRNKNQYPNNLLLLYYLNHPTVSLQDEHRWDTQNT